MTAAPIVTTTPIVPEWDGHPNTIQPWAIHNYNFNAPRRVAKGAAVLDEKRPGWEKLDLRKLRMGNPRLDIITLMGLRIRRDNTAAEHGFCAQLEDRGHGRVTDGGAHQADILTEEWKKAVYARRKPRAPRCTF
jgi:hypothetical protein